MKQIRENKTYNMNDRPTFAWCEQFPFNAHSLNIINQTDRHRNDSDMVIRVRVYCLNECHVRVDPITKYFKNESEKWKEYTW